MEISLTELLGPGEVIEEEPMDDESAACGSYSDILQFEFKDHPGEDGSNLFPEDPCDNQFKEIF